MTSPNPYAPPPAPSSSMVDASMDKARRTNLINRRTTALVIEETVYMVTFGALISGLTLRLLGGESPLLQAIIAGAPFYLLRDVLGTASFGKRLVGLGLVATDGSSPSAGARMLRNAIMVVPVIAAIEYFVAFYGNSRMQRLGDMMAKTHVVDLDPDRFGKSSYSWQMLGAIVLAAVTWIAVVPAISGWVAHL